MSRFFLLSPRFSETPSPIVDLPNHLSTDSARAFADFVASGTLLTISVSDTNYSDLRWLARFWEIRELHKRLDTFLNDSADPNRHINLRIDELISGLEKRRGVPLDTLIYVADHFTDFLRSPKLLDLDLPILLQITDQHFALDSTVTDDIFAFLIRALDVIGPNASILLRAVDLSSLAPPQLAELLANPNLRIDLIKRNLTRQSLKVIHEVARYEQQAAELKRQLKAVVRFCGGELLRWDPAITIEPTLSGSRVNVRPFTGLIAWLTEQHPKRQVVTVTAEDALAENGPFSAACVMDLKGSQRFTSAGEKAEPWIQYHFHGVLVDVTHYEIKSAMSVPKGGHPRSWKLQGLGADGQWVELDAKEKVDLLNDDGIIATIPVSNNRGGRFKSLRLTMTEPNEKGKWWLTLSAWEIYGTLVGQGS